MTLRECLRRSPLFLFMLSVVLTLLEPRLAAAATGTLLRNDTGLYPRVLRLQYSGAANGRILASVVSFSGANGIGAIYESGNGGSSFTQVGTIADPLAAGGLCCSTLYELPRAIGANPAGTLLWAASVGQGVADRRMALRVWKSTDLGRTWTYLSSVAVAPNTGGLWEPEFSVAADGTLVCHYADETDGVHSQKLVRARTSDGVTWRDWTDTVASTVGGHRPGMPVVRQYANGTYAMALEICGLGGQHDCVVHYRSSPDGWNWGTVTDIGFRPETAAGRYFKHAPTIALGPNNALFLIGQMYFNVDGVIAAGNGRTILVNTQNGAGSWSELAAPVAVPGAANNYCPNYSSTLLPTANGASILEIATDYDGTVCKPYFASGPVGATPTPPVAQASYGGTNGIIANGSTIQVENYDVGGAGVAYSDTSAGNASAQYRTDAVDIEVTTDTGGGYNLDWTVAGEWLEYTVNTTAGTYTMTARIASAAAAPADFRVLLDGVVLGTFATSATGGWQTWADVSISGIAISGGTNRVLRIEVVDGSDCNLNYLRFTSATTPTATTRPTATATATARSTATPTTTARPRATATTPPGTCAIGAACEAETALLGGGVVASTQHAGYTGSGFADYQGNGTGFVEWTVNVPTAGTYALNIRYGNGGAADRPMSIQVNGTTVVSSLSFPVTGWTSWTVRSQSVSLPAGSVRIRATELPNGPNVDNLTVTATGTTPTATAAATATATATARSTATPTARPAGGALVSQGRPALASSEENAANAAGLAVDGNTGTRWSSAFADPQWIRVDLGSSMSISRVVLSWEAAYGSAYQIQTSPDAITWATIYSTTTGNGASDDLTGLIGSGRYVRMYGTARATAWGYSLWEFQVYN